MYYNDHTFKYQGVCKSAELVEEVGNNHPKCGTIFIERSVGIRNISLTNKGCGWPYNYSGPLLDATSRYFTLFDASLANLKIFTMYLGPKYFVDASSVHLFV
jgi:hypothetical protein